MKYLICILLCLGCYSAMAEDAANTVVPYTLADKERSIRMEEKMNARFDAIDSRFESIEARFSMIEKLLYFILSAILGLIGFIIFDRRAAMKPFESKAENIEEKYRTLLQVVKDFAKTNKEMEAVMRFNNLL
jgi:cell division protein FtsL